MVIETWKSEEHEKNEKKVFNKILIFLSFTFFTSFFLINDSLTLCRHLFIHKRIVNWSRLMYKTPLGFLLVSDCIIFDFRLWWIHEWWRKRYIDVRTCNRLWQAYMKYLSSIKFFYHHYSEVQYLQGNTQFKPRKYVKKNLKLIWFEINWAWNNIL